MATYIILSRFAPDDFKDPKAFKQLAADVSARIKRECPGVTWRASYVTLGRFDAVDIVESSSAPEVTRAALIIRGHGHAYTETLPADEWKAFIDRL
jgi:uncharacterized protein with GYD domain